MLLPTDQLLLITEATTDCYEAVSLLITNNCLYVINAELDIVVKAIKLVELHPMSGIEDPTLVAFRIQPPKEQVNNVSDKLTNTYYLRINEHRLIRL